ncbi:DUF262 domain-containing HNH endonuclease family protein [Acinetobacter ursingii]|uniref:DUF262 domain-containing protein n=1 Tax=Acinetobacter ursingii TaxID=108980 RepID=UPI003008737E
MASIKIKDFFNGRFFEIPKYQRGYAWEIQNIRDLFDDIIESIESNSNHYIGTIVLSKSNDDDEKFYIVDGQQRTTTITLIISSLIKQLSDKDASYYERFYLKEDERYRISPLNRDQNFFTSILEGIINEPQNKSQRFLREAIEEINFKVSQIDDKLKFLKSVEKLEVMEFVENSEGDAIRIFQTVNDRGKPLSNMEKAKSLLIYFSNRYLDKSLDDTINEHFSDIFEIYDDIKHLGEELSINLIKNKDFNEDNLMRYHFVTYSNENYDPTANYVLQFLKNQLTKFRNETNDSNYPEMHKFISDYIASLKDFFANCKAVIERAKTEEKFFKIFVVLNLSATLYPLIIKLQSFGLLDKALTGKGRESFNFYDLVELIEVRVYKTRATDPKADIARLVYRIDTKEAEDIENWLIWFNGRWMPKEEFQSNLSRGIYGNRALNHIFITYCEYVNKIKYSITDLQDLVKKSPNIEHILSQTPTFDPIALGFDNKEDFIDFEHTIGNLTVLEKGLNSNVQNKNAIDKIDGYGKSLFTMTRMLGSEIDTNKGFNKESVQKRTQTLADYCMERWWSERSIENPLTKVEEDNYIVDEFI